jgi:hypothetical protein
VTDQRRSGLCSGVRSGSRMVGAGTRRGFRG